MPREKKASPLAKNKKVAAAAPSKTSSSSSSTSESVKAPPPPPSAPAVQPKQPGLLAQAASTAGGVAIGSSVGHAVGNMLTSGKSAEKSDAAAVGGENKSAKNGPCEVELHQLMDCINRQPELNACQPFFETLKQCRTSNGLPSKGFQ